MCSGTTSVVKLAVEDKNAPVIAARLTIFPVTILGRIAVQPGVGSVRRRLVKSYPA